MLGRGLTGLKRAKTRPTSRQTEFITNLLEQCGYDPDDYNFNEMSFEEASALIDELREELAIDYENESRWDLD